MIRVLVVDDSAVIRRLVSSALRQDPDFEVVGVAVDGEEAVQRIAELQPDAVTLDIEMPRVTGLEALPRIRARWPKLPVVMLSTLTERGARATLDALSLGASDYVAKPQNAGSVADALDELSTQLCPRLRALVGVRRMLDGSPAAASGAAAPVDAPAPAVTPAVPLRAPAVATVRPELLVMGSSTGGPDALVQMAADVPATWPVPVLVVLHMPPVFTAMFAERLDRVCPLEVREAVEDEVVRPGQVRIAPGDFHLTVERTALGPRTHLDQRPAENFCRPAVDPLFRSAAQEYGAEALGVVLTGMGHDGLDGSRALTVQGATVVVQDEETSVVWGMPGAVAEAGLASAVLPLSAIVDDLRVRLQR